MEIVRIGSADDEAVATFHRIYVDAGRFDSPEAFRESPGSEIADVLRHGTARFSFAAFLGYIRGVAVASSWCAADVKDDPNLIYLTTRVLPSRRRRGYGSEMLARGERHAAELGRTRLGVSANWQAGYGPTGTGSPAVEFAATHGWSLALTNVMSRLALPVPDRRLDALAFEAANHHPGYTLKAWSGPVPDDLVAQWAEMAASLSGESPQGDLEVVPEAPSIEAVRDDERILAESGQTKFNAVAVSAEGQVVGYSDVVAQPAAPRPAHQWETLVRSPHRGHRLGLALKLAVVRQLQSERPDVSSIITSNAAANGHMLAVNHALGYERIEYRGDFEKRLV